MVKVFEKTCPICGILFTTTDEDKQTCSTMNNMKCAGILASRKVGRL